MAMLKCWPRGSPRTSTSYARAFAAALAAAESITLWSTLWLIAKPRNWSPSESMVRGRNWLESAMKIGIACQGAGLEARTTAGQETGGTTALERGATTDTL